jgi:DNA-3-methyladenine glycosylase
MRLNENFYKTRAPELAPFLLGKVLCRRVSGEIVRREITETECYFGESDSACHASRGRTARNDIMYGDGGRAYVYLCYGMHHMLNVVSGSENFPEAVLIRGISGFDGPGKLTKFLKITRELNGENLATSEHLWIEDVGAIPKYLRGKRVGINYASEEYREKLWRFTIIN